MPTRLHGLRPPKVASNLGHPAGKGVCKYCIGDIAAAARESGLRSLVVRSLSDNKTYYWTQGMRRIK